MHGIHMVRSVIANLVDPEENGYALLIRQEHLRLHPNN